MIADSVAIHLLFVVPLFGIPLFNLALLFWHTSAPRAFYLLRVVAPAYVFLLSVVGFTGIVLMLLTQSVSLSAVVMGVSLGVVCTGEVMRVRRQKRVRVSDAQQVVYFRSWAKRKYALDLALLALSVGVGLV